MRQGRGLVLLGLSVFVSAAVLAGCGPSDSQKAQRTARTFIAAMQDGDRAAVERIITRAARERVGASGIVPERKDGKSGSGFSLGEPVVQGDTAIVPATLTEKDRNAEVTIRLRREEKEWRVYAMTVPMIPGGPPLTCDFEHPEAAFADSFREMGRAAGYMAAGMAKAAEGFAQGFQESANQMAEQARTKGETPPFPIIETTPTPGAKR